MMLYDYDMEKHIKSEKAYEYERGMERGREETEKALATRWWQNGKSLEEIMDDLGKSEQYVRTLLGN